MKTMKNNFLVVMKKLFIHCSTMSALLLFLSSCGENNSETNSREVMDKLKFELNMVNLNIKCLEKGVKEQEQDYSALLERIEDLEIKNESKSKAYFNISKGISNCYQVIETPEGHFFISLSEVNPYLSGYKLVFSIGNPYQATYDNSKLKVRWNRSYQSWKNDKEYASKMNDYERLREEYWKKFQNEKPNSLKMPERPIRPFWSKEEKEKELTLKDALKPGSWNTIEVHVTPATLDQLDYIEVSLETSAVLLSRTH